MFKRLFTTGTMEQCVLIAALCWSLWNRRNKWVWNKIDMSVFGTKSVAINLLEDWKRAQQEKVKCTPTINSRSRCWQKPPVGWVKINIDAATFMQDNSIGIGGVIRDDRGDFVRAMCQQVEGLWQPREAEAITLRELLSWTKKYGFVRCVFETDSKLLADAYN
ncbi:uncharacterized protein LOC141665080 [Apium graveolens]|uniref:uncharacterized protein LOC141665080 n=1 Tax=Apium graveolens TaxID=4045 RepID=UPI003D79569A